MGPREKTEGAKKRGVLVDGLHENLKRTTMASQAMHQIFLREINGIDPVTEDFGKSELNFEGVSKFMRFGGPEHNGRLVKSVALSNTPEAIVVMSKVVEAFIMDAGLKSWMAKEIEPKTDLKNATEVQVVDLLRTIKVHEPFDFMSDVARVGDKKKQPASSSSNLSSQKKKKSKS